MKQLIIKTGFFILFLFIIGAGCVKEDFIVLEIVQGSENAVLQKDLNGIGFSFYLINEQGDTTTLFRENENIIFCFSFKNNTGEIITINTEFINSDFFRVFHSEDNKDMGKAWTGMWCLFSMAGAPHDFTLKQYQSVKLTCPWLKDDEKHPPTYPLCKSESSKCLTKGKYYTAFDLNFQYQINKKKYIIHSITFKLNFEVI